MQKLRSVFAVGSFALALLMPSSVSAAAVDDAFVQLAQGRKYLLNFPTGKPRMDLIREYLQASDKLVISGEGSFGQLEAAMAAAVTIRNSSATTPQDRIYAERIAQEALEAALTGQLFAGNCDLLNALRVAFPTTVGGPPPGAERPLPKGLPTQSNGLEYKGANLINLGYARAHFLRGATLLLDYLASDIEGNLRIKDRLNFPLSPQYTRFNNPDNLPHPQFRDPNFASEKPPSQTDAYLYGNVLNRLGLANISLADKLWRAAFFGKDNAPVRGEMLAKGAAELRKGAHAEFLAVLPLAAILNDGSNEGEENDFQLARLEQNQSMVASAASLIDRLNSGDAPKLESLNLNVADDDVQRQISDTAEAVLALSSLHAEAKSEVDKVNSAEQLKSSDILNVRSQFEDQMIRICGIDPAIPPFNGLKTAEQRQAYKQRVEVDFDARMKAGLASASLVDGSEMGKAAIGVLRAFSDIDAASVEIKSIPQLIQIEVQRNNEVNSVVTSSGAAFAAIDIATGFLRALPRSFVGFPTSGAEFDVAQIPIGFLEAAKTLIATDKETFINTINSRAEVRRLLLRGAELTSRMPSIVAQARLAIAEMNSQHQQLKRLIDNHVFFQDTTSSLWYYDPSVVFEQFEAERRYQDQLRVTQIHLYVLAAKLASRWTEQYQNPFREDATTFRTLGPENFDDFTDPESYFNVADHNMAKLAYRSLRTWDGAMRVKRPFVVSSLSAPISVRQDLFGLSDYRWDTNTLAFAIDAQKRARNLALFRSILLNAQTPNSARNVIELEFGINYFSPRRSTTTAFGFSAKLLPTGPSDWNERLTKVSASLEGRNVSATPTVPITLYQYGRIYSQGFFNKDDAARVDNLALYFRDPRRLASRESWEGKQQLVLNAALGNGIGELLDVSGRALSPFCDRYLLVIERERLVAPVNIENISDIALRMDWSIGHPLNYNWPQVL